MAMNAAGGRPENMRGPWSRLAALYLQPRPVALLSPRCTKVDVCRVQYSLHRFCKGLRFHNGTMAPRADKHMDKAVDLVRLI